MYPNLSGQVNNDRQINEVDIMRDAYLFDVGRSFMACPATDPKTAMVTIIPNNARVKFGMKQPRVKAPGTRVTAIAFSPYEPNVVFVGTQSGHASIFELPPNGLKGDASKPFGQQDLKDEVKCCAFHPIAKSLVAIGLRNGHVVVYDKSMKECHIDLAHQRPLNAVAWSQDGTVLYALYVDMVLKAWDVRAKSQIAEVKVSATRGLGFLQALPDKRVLCSFSQGGKQELRIYDAELKEVAARQAGVNGTPLSVSVHFTGLILAVGSHENKVAVLDGNTLAEICSIQAYQPVLGAACEMVRPDPDGAIVLSASAITTGNTIIRIEFSVPSAPALFERPCPTWASPVEAAAWVGGDNGSFATEELKPSPKEEAKVVVEEKIEVGPQTFFKYLNAYADPPSEYYINLPVGQAPNPEFNEVATNGKDFAFIGAGNTPSIIVMPLGKPQRYPKDHKQVIIDPHGSGVCTISYSPHDPNFLMSAGEDCTVKLWEIPSEWNEPLREPTIKLNHQRGVKIAKFSQAVRNLVMSCTQAPEMAFWDLNTYQKVRTFDPVFQSPIQDADMNEYANTVYTILRDGHLVAFDPRSEKPDVTTVMAHKNGGRHRRVLNIPEFDYLATFGSSDRGERQVAIWDRKNLEKPLKTIELDTATGAMLPLYEEGSGLIYLGGKGDGHIRYVELCKDDRIIASSGVYETSAPERGLCLLPRTQCDIMGCEVSRMLKLATESMHVVHWRLLRKRMELFQDDIYRPIRDTSRALMEVSDWLGGQNEVYPMVSLQPPGTKKATEVVPVFRHRSGSGKYRLEDVVEEEKLTPEFLAAHAPKISSESDEEKEDSESW